MSRKPKPRRIEVGDRVVVAGTKRAPKGEKHRTAEITLTYGQVAAESYERPEGAGPRAPKERYLYIATLATDGSPNGDRRVRRLDDARFVTLVYEGDVVHGAS